jgi:hypothetical protein
VTAKEKEMPDGSMIKVVGIERRNHSHPSHLSTPVAVPRPPPGGACRSIR